MRNKVFTTICIFFFNKFKNEMSTLKMILVWQFYTAPVDVWLERDDCKFTELFGDA